MKPLAGKRIVITRPAGQAAPFIGKIEKAGGTAYAVPLIAFKMYGDGHDKAILEKLHTYEWIIFTSRNGVDFFMQKAGHLIKKSPVHYAAIGKKTAEAIQSYGLPVAYIPKQFSADHLVKEIKSGLFLPEKALIPKGNLAKSVIGDAIRQAGKQADDWIVYETYFPEEEKKKLLEIIRHGRVDMYTFASPSAVRHFVKVLEEEHEPLPDAHFACIGPETKKEALTYGMAVSVCPSQYTMDALVHEISKFYKE